MLGGLARYSGRREQRGLTVTHSFTDLEMQRSSLRLNQPNTLQLKAA